MAMNRMGALALVLLLAATGCTDADDEPNGATATTSSAGQGGMNAGGSGGVAGVGGMGGAGGTPGCADGDYPPGPYGTQLGQTLPNVLLRAYVNDTAEGLANSQPLVDSSLDDARKSCKGYALVHVSDYTWSSCQAAAGEIAAGAKAVVDAGGVVIEVLGSNAGGPATIQDVDNWINGHGLTVTTATDAAGMELTAWSTIGPHHKYYVVDLVTMQIVSLGRTPPVSGIQEAVDLLNQ